MTFIKTSVDATVNLNDKLYKFCSTKGVFTYVVTGKVSREQGDFLELECAACSHYGEKCQVLVAPNPSGGWHFVQMINNPEESHWHADTERWFEKSSEALKHSLRGSVQAEKDKIISFNAGIKAAEERILKYSNYIKATELKEENGE